MKTQPLRTMFRWSVTLLLVFPLSALSSQFIQFLASAYNWDQSALTFMGPVVFNIAATTHHLWFQILSATVAGGAISAWVVHLLPKVEIWAREDTLCEWSLSIQGVATLKNERNIKRWLVLPMGVVELADGKGNILSRSPTITLVFLIYQDFVAARQFHLELEGRAPPHYEVRDNNAHGCVIVITGDLNGCLLKVRVEV